MPIDIGETTTLSGSARTLATLAFAFGLTGLACGNGGLPSGSYKEGELGNGDFVFACEDGVACLPYSNDAKRFPKSVATGATFRIRFAATRQDGSTVYINDHRYDGVTTAPVPPFLSEGPDGLTAVQPGYATVVARDIRGTVLDFVTIKIVQPDGLVVYDANFDATKSSNPPRLQNVTLKVGDVPSYRVVSEYKLETVAGAVPVRWESLDESIVAIESYASGAVTFRAKTAGATHIRAIGAALTKDIAVEVKP